MLDQSRNDVMYGTEISMQFQGTYDSQLKNSWFYFRCNRIWNKDDNSYTMTFLFSEHTLILLTFSKLPCSVPHEERHTVFGSSFLAETFFPLQQTLEKTLLHPIFLMIHANIFDFWFLETQFSQDILPFSTDFLAYAVEMVFCYWLSVTSRRGYIAAERFCLIGRGICQKIEIIFQTISSLLP